MTVKYGFKIQDVAKLSQDLDVAADVYHLSGRWSTNPETVPSSVEADEGEMLMHNSAKDAVLHWASQFTAGEDERRKERAGCIINADTISQASIQAETDLIGCVKNFREERSLFAAKRALNEEHLRRLQQLHGITRAPRYAKKPLLVWLLALFVVLLETGPNGGIMAQVVEGGLIAGWILAFLISLANVSTGVLTGLFLPRMWALSAAWSAKRIAAGVLGVCAISTSVVLNLAVSFVRAHGTVNLTTDLSLFWQGNWVPSSLESLSLFLFGIAIATATALKFAALHDPIREYEQADRKVKALTASIDKIDHEVPAMLQEHGIAAKAVLDTLVEAGRLSLVNFQESLISSETAQQDYKNGCQRIVALYEQCIERRRNALKLASLNTPAWWKDAKGKIDLAMPDIFSLADDVIHSQVLKDQYSALLISATAAEAEIETALRKARGLVELTPVRTGNAGNGLDDKVVQMQFRHESTAWD